MLACRVWFAVFVALSTMTSFSVGEEDEKQEVEPGRDETTTAVALVEAIDPEGSEQDKEMLATLLKNVNKTAKYRWWPYGYGYGYGYVYQALCADNTVPISCCYFGLCNTGYTCQYPGYICCLTTTVVTNVVTTTTNICPTGVTTTTACTNLVCPTGQVCVSTPTATNICCPATFTQTCADGTVGLGPCVNLVCAANYACVNNACCRINVGRKR